MTTEITPARTPFPSQIVWAGDLTASDSLETVGRVASATCAELTLLIAWLRAGHPHDLKDAVGYNTVIALERAAHELGVAVRVSGWSPEPEPVADEAGADAEPVEPDSEADAPSGEPIYQVFAVVNGVPQAMVMDCGTDEAAAEEAAANGNAAAQPGVSFVVMKVQA